MELKHYGGSEFAKKVRETDTTRVYRYCPTPFGGPDRKNALRQADLSNEFFHEGTNFADNGVGSKVKSFYEHNLNDRSNPFMKRDAQFLGYAELVEIDERGRWFEIEIEKSHAYADFIEALDQKGLLGASTQAFPNGVERTPVGDLKRLDMWLESENGPCVAPMHPDTLTLVSDDKKSAGDLFIEYFELLKSCGVPYVAEIDGEEVELNAETAPLFAKAINEHCTKSDAVETQKEEPEAVDESFESELLDVLEDDDNSAVVLETVVDELKSLRAEVKQMSTYVSAYVDMWGSLEDAQTISDMFARLSEVATQDDMKAVQTGIKSFAEQFVKEFRQGFKTLRDVGQRDPFEVEADAVQVKSRRQSNAIQFPEHAPGGD